MHLKQIPIHCIQINISVIGTLLITYESHDKFNETGEELFYHVIYTNVSKTFPLGRYLRTPTLIDLFKNWLKFCNIYLNQSVRFITYYNVYYHLFGISRIV